MQTVSPAIDGDEHRREVQAIKDAAKAARFAPPTRAEMIEILGLPPELHEALRGWGAEVTFKEQYGRQGRWSVDVFFGGPTVRDVLAWLLRLGVELEHDPQVTEYGAGLWAVTLRFLYPR